MRKAVILAAGVGSRLRPITDSKPKCMVTVAGKPILEHQISAYLDAGISNIVVVAGYRADMVQKWCEERYPKHVNVIVNSRYETTNNMYSLYLARGEVQSDGFILSNGDVVYDPSIIKDLVEHPGEDLIGTEAGSYDEEAMKVVVKDGFIRDISKGIPKDKAYGRSIDLYKISKKVSHQLFAEIDRVINTEHQLQDWTEVAIRNIVADGQAALHPYDIGSRNWVEIDDHRDLSLADDVFGLNKNQVYNYKLLLIDLDGTIYLGEEPIPGAAEWIKSIQDNEQAFYFLSNNSSRSKKEYVDKLASMGIEVEESHIILSTDGVVQYLQSEGT